PLRWQTWIAHARSTAIWLTNGHRDSESPDDRGANPLEVDMASHTLAVTIDQKHGTRETWKYSRPAPDQLVIDGVHAGKYLHVALHRAPDGLLVTRGFHWINEAPYNR